VNAFTWLRRSPRLAVVVAVVGVAAVAAAVAFAATGPAIQTSTPHFADQVTNIDVLRQQIRNYYGDPLGTGVFGAESNYAREAGFVADQGGHWLAARAHAHYPSGMKAIVLDVDDTTLATWNYEVYSNWAYNPTTNATFVLGELFPAVPGMVDMVQRAKAEGYTIIWITGRPAAQEAATLGNLTKTDVGYPAPTALPTATLGGGADGLFTKPAIADYPPYLQTACADEIAAGKSCTTIHYKSATRGYVESLGYEIVANFGDQFSDFTGGFEDRTFKMPNPNYYLP